MKVLRYKRWLSYLLPIKIATRHSDYGTIQLSLYQNQWMLSTAKAIYSFGNKYTPFEVTFQEIKESLPSVESFLLLGAGIGSALHILQSKYNCYPISTLVDLNEQAKALSLEAGSIDFSRVNWHIGDAVEFIATSNQTFDLIGVDLFIDTKVNPNTLHANFINNIQNALSSKGIAIFNYIFSNQEEQKKLERILADSFKNVHIHVHSKNVFYTCSNL